MRKLQKPDRPDAESNPPRRLTRRAVLAALGAGVAAGKMRGAESEAPGGPLPPWYRPCKNSYEKKIGKSSGEKRDRLELELLALKMEAIEAGKISASRDTGSTPPRGKS